jgi:hypothetical protein
MAKKTKARRRAPRGRWSRRDINLLKRLFPVTATSKIAKKMGRKTDAVKKKASRMGLEKSKAYLRRIGRA